MNSFFNVVLLSDASYSLYKHCDFSFVTIHRASTVFLYQVSTGVHMSVERDRYLVQQSL